jgi:hypothetical protein
MIADILQVTRGTSTSTTEDRTTSRAVFCTRPLLCAHCVYAVPENEKTKTGDRRNVPYTNCAATVIGGKSEYWGNSYSFDEWENLFNETMTKCSSEYLYTTVDVNNRVHVSGTDYQYDAAGNMTNDQTDSLTSIYDQENRISSAPEMESPQPIPMTAPATA